MPLGSLNLVFVMNKDIAASNLRFALKQILNYLVQYLCS